MWAYCCLAARMNRDEFFAQLENLSPKEIEARLSSWDKEKLVLVHEFLQQRHSEVPQSEQQAAGTETDAAWAAMEAATRAKSRATIAIIIFSRRNAGSGGIHSCRFFGLKH